MPGIKGQMLYKVPRIVTFTETENRIEVSGVWSKGRLFNRYTVSVWVGGNLEMDVGDGCTTL